MLRLATGSYEVTIEGQAFIIGLMAGSALGIVLHELLHGVFFLAFGARPRFGFKPWTRFGPVFYASAPGSYLTKTEYAAAGLAPLALLTMLLLVCAALAPPGGLILSAVLWAYLLNAVGSIGDMLLMRKMVSYPVGTWFEDTGDGFVAYGPGSGEGHRSRPVERRPRPWQHRVASQVGGFGVVGCVDTTVWQSLE